MCKYSAILYKGLSILGFGYPRGVLETIAHGHRGTTIPTHILPTLCQSLLSQELKKREDEALNYFVC